MIYMLLNPALVLHPRITHSLLAMDEDSLMLPLGFDMSHQNKLGEVESEWRQVQS